MARVVSILIVAVGLCRSAEAQFGVPLGPEFRINSTTGGISGHSPSAAMTSGGRLFVVWTGLGADGDGLGIVGRRFSSAGTPEGPEFQVNTAITNDQTYPVVAMNLLGSAVVVWQSLGQDGSGSGIYAQRYDPAGAPAGPEFRVNTSILADQDAPGVSIDGLGRFVVGWRGFNAGGGRAIFGQRFDEAGRAVGPEFEVGPAATGFEGTSVAMNAAGRFVVAWSNGGAHARIYDSSGAALSAVIDVRGAAFPPSVGIDDEGRFVVTFTDYTAGPSLAIFHDASGARLAQVYLPKAFDFFAGVVTSGNGDSLVFGLGWGQRAPAGATLWPNEVNAQAYGPTGVPRSSPFPVNAIPGSEPYQPAGALGGPGLSTVLWWHSGSGPNVGEIHGVRYGALRPPQPLSFHTLTPCRVIDTREPDGPRAGPALAAGRARPFGIEGSCGVPTTAQALAVNLVATQPSSAGYLTFVAPSLGATDLPSFINYGPGQTRSNNAILALSPGSELTVRCEQASGTVHFILDVVGYFE